MFANVNKQLGQIGSQHARGCKELASRCLTPSPEELRDQFSKCRSKDFRVHPLNQRFQLSRHPILGRLMVRSLSPRFTKASSLESNFQVTAVVMTLVVWVATPLVVMEAVVPVAAVNSAAEMLGDHV